MENTETALQVDIEKVSGIAVVPAILEAVCRVTGLGFAAVARVTPERWIACSVKDDIQFGMRTGGELKVDTTICHEIRQSGEGVIIDEVAKDEFYCMHATPAMYGFQSYISIPIVKYDGSFFGTLCAIDPNPAVLRTPHIIDMFKAFTNLISIHLNAIEQLPAEQVQLLEDHSLNNLKECLKDILGDKETTAVLQNKKSKELADMVQRAIKSINDLAKQLRDKAAMN